VASTTWRYVNGSSTSGASGITHGSILFTRDLPAGEWFAAFFQNNGYTEIAPRVAFYVGNEVTLAATKDNYNEGETVRIDFAGAPGGATDWIGIYKVDRNPGSGSPAVKWAYAGTTAGFREFNGLAKGYYYAVFMVNDAYQEISPRVRFSVGTLIASVSMPASVAEGTPLTVTFANGPGIPKDWIGLYRDGDTPGVQELIQYLYFEGATGGQVSFQRPDLPPGRYWVAMFTNDSYTEVSNRAYFDVVALAFEEFRLDSEQVRLRWKSVPGESYTVQKNTGLAPGSWQDVQTLTATGTSTETTVPLVQGATRGFYRIRINH
jgi:hypothetical protein